VTAVKLPDDDALGTSSSVGDGSAKTDETAANAAIVLKDFIIAFDITIR